MLVKVGLAGLIGAFVIFYILTSPDAAANIVHATWALMVRVAHGLGTFFDKLAS